MPGQVGSAIANASCIGVAVGAFVVLYVLIALDRVRLYSKQQVGYSKQQVGLLKDIKNALEGVLVAFDRVGLYSNQQVRLLTEIRNALHRNQIADSLTPGPGLP